MILDLDTADKIIGGTGLIGIAIFAGRKMFSFWQAEGATRAGSSAIEAQFKSLQESIKAGQVDALEFRAQLALFDRKLHQQQRTITRMEMLLRQFSSLVRQHGIDIPSYMQKELDELIEADIDRNTSDARTFP